MTADEKSQYDFLKGCLINQSGEDMNKVLSAFGALAEKTDTYQKIEGDVEDSNPLNHISYEIFSKVWPEACAMRKNGLVFEMGKNIKCDIVAFHGDYDAYPLENIKHSLEKTTNNLKFYHLNKCGHYPWKETYAKDLFYKILKNEII